MEINWSDAPVDALGLILSNLVGRDALAFASVCRAWKSVIKLRPSDKELLTCPCLILPNKRFFNPMHGMMFEHKTVHPMPDGDILAQNYGWLLLAKGHDALFFFEPFTGDRIDLPAAPTLFATSVTFTSPPNCQDCEIICIRPDCVDNNVKIQTIKRGEDEFNVSYDFDCTKPGFWMQGNYKIVYYLGEYYYMGREGNLGIYNPRTNEHKFTRSAYNLWPHFYAYDCGRFLFEGEGDLWAVFIANKGEKICVCKLDLGKKRWKKVYDLGDRMVFLSHKSCYMERAEVRGLGNKIHFPRLHKGNCLFYSLATKKYHTFERGTSFHNFENIREMLDCTWFKMRKTEAPSSETCIKELSW